MMRLCLSAMWMEIKLSYIFTIFQHLGSSVCCTFVDLFIMTPASVSAGLHNKIKEAIVPLSLNHLDGMTFAPYV